MKPVTARTKNIESALKAYMSVEQAAADGTPAMGLFSGKAGLGKTTAGAWLFAKADGVLVRCLRADTLGTFLERLAIDLGLETSCRRADMLNYIVRELALNSKAVFVDEADYLADKVPVLETLRDIYDLANVPIILIGYEQLPKKIKRLPQLLSRISQHVEFQPADENDIVTMSESLVEGCAIEKELLLELLAKSKGNFRRITVGLGYIEKFCQANDIKLIRAEQWAQRPFFPNAEL